MSNNRNNELTEKKILESWKKTLKQFLENGGKIELTPKEKQQILQAQQAFEVSKLSNFRLGGPLYKLLG
jgi:hypothetical protein